MEKLAKGLVVILILLAAAVPLVGKLITTRAETIELRARMPENGGWSQDVINGQVNVPIKLRMTSDDVVHSFALGQSSLPSVEIFPGKFSETELTFDQPGEYTFYCTRWCGDNHWRMRGTIIITGPSTGVQPTSFPPLFLRLGLDLDAPHLAGVLPANRPNAAQGKELANFLPAMLTDGLTVWSNSPESLWEGLQADTKTEVLDDQQVWDMVVWGLSLQGGSDWLVQGRELYTQNCLACHGESGQGDGVMVRDLPPMNHDKMGREATRPPDFSNPAVLLGASPALLEGKIIRGGMGTGMPYWGNIFTSEQIRSLVLYLYTFQLDLEVIP
jgi:hypothetical protein